MEDFQDRSANRQEAEMRNFPYELRHPSGATLRLDPTRLLLAFRNAESRMDAEARVQDMHALETGGAQLSKAA